MEADSLRPHFWKWQQGMLRRIRMTVPPEISNSGGLQEGCEVEGSAGVEAAGRYRVRMTRGHQANSARYS
jgi:hypothetical protein